MGSLRNDTLTIEWQTTALDVTFVQNENGVICVHSLLPHGTKAFVPASALFFNSDLPLASVRLVGEGNTSDKTAKCLVGSYVSARLRYQSHNMGATAEKETLDIQSFDPFTGIRVVTHFVVHKDIPVLRSSATIKNMSENTSVVVTQISSLTIGGLTTSSEEWVSDYSIMTATNGWFREAQWRQHSLPDVGIDDNGICQLRDGHNGSQANFNISSRGSFSTGTYLPMGLLKRKDNNDTWLWQIEHNGSWRWEIGDYKDSVYLAAGGPTAVDHSWKLPLGPGQSFTTVTTACCRVQGGADAAFGALTEYRRKIRRPHADNENLPIIFNDYMNCLMGDPDEDKIQALLPRVSRSGADYFVIDAGWYADDSNWWDDVGLWEPSKKRFPSGFKKLLDTIKGKSLIPGLWLEPEVVGVRSIVAKRLPEDAFFQEGGQRVLERGRYQLDYRHPEVRKWMNSVVRRLVIDYGVGYFKFDYNIEVIQGTEANATSSGAAHLEHQRAYLSWIKELLEEFPDLVIENCSSGAQRMEYAMLSVHPLQSTSDQQDPVLYAVIAAAVPTAVTPEQSATWAYPQPKWDDEINALTVVNTLLGRIHLSGRLDLLSEPQFELITEGMSVYKDIRRDLRNARPIWPLGLPKWHDNWICLGMITKADDVYLSVWRRGGATEIKLPLPSLKKNPLVRPRLLYPSKFEAVAEWDAEEGALRVRLPSTVCARLFRLSK
jgi:alpha-galactosidase